MPRVTLITLNQQTSCIVFCTANIKPLKHNLNVLINEWRRQSTLFVVAYATTKKKWWENSHHFPMRIVLIGQTFNSFVHLWHQPHPSIHPFSFALIMQGCRNAGVYPSCLKVTAGSHNKSLVHHRTTRDNRSLTPHSDTRNWPMLPWGDCLQLHHHVALETALSSFDQI